MLREIIQQACEKYGVTEKEIMERNRRPKLVAARRWCWCELRELGWSSSKIGKAFNRDYSTVIQVTGNAKVTSGRNSYEYAERLGRPKFTKPTITYRKIVMTKEMFEKITKMRAINMTWNEVARAVNYHAKPDSLCSEYNKHKTGYKKLDMKRGRPKIEDKEVYKPKPVVVEPTEPDVDFAAHNIPDYLIPKYDSRPLNPREKRLMDIGRRESSEIYYSARPSSTGFI